MAELDRCFLLDDKARGLIESKRLPHTRLGYHGRYQSRPIM